MQRPCRIAAAGATVVLLGFVSSAHAEPSVLRPAGSRSVTVVDPAVMPAGGPQCRHCGATACKLHRGHAADCRDGMCAPHCPVRPSQYGFYRTQWRRWPDQGVTPVNAEQAATPAPPPKSLVPSAEEESPRSPEEESASPDAGVTEPPAAPGQPAARKQDAEAIPADPIPQNPVRDGAGRTDAIDPAASEPSSRVPPVPPGEQPLSPQPEPAGGAPDQSSAPAEDAEPIGEVGALRYPAKVGRSLAAGSLPWRLQPATGQRAADSARGL